MNSKEQLKQLFMSFFVITTCITIAEGILGLLFFPDVKLGYEAFFSPVLFGFFSAIFGLVSYSKKELSIRQTIFRDVIHLLMIEAFVFGLNALNGQFFEFIPAIILAVTIAVIYLIVALVMWINDKKSADKFNANLKKFQENK